MAVTEETDQNFADLVDKFKRLREEEGIDEAKKFLSLLQEAGYDDDMSRTMSKDADDVSWYAFVRWAKNELAQETAGDVKDDAGDDVQPFVPSAGSEDWVKSMHLYDAQKKDADGSGVLSVEVGKAGKKSSCRFKEEVEEVEAAEEKTLAEPEEEKKQPSPYDYDEYDLYDAFNPFEVTKGAEPEVQFSVTTSCPRRTTRVESEPIDRVDSEFWQDTANDVLVSHQRLMADLMSTRQAVKALDKEIEEERRLEMLAKDSMEESA